MHNNEPKNNIAYEDALHLHTSILAIESTIKNIDPSLSIEILPLLSMSELSSEIHNKMQLNDSVRGFIFMGHGNSQYYAFSRNEVYDSDGDLVSHINKASSQNKFSELVTIYFPGCDMAHGQNSFQEKLALNLNSNLQTDTKNTQASQISKYEVIAHDRPVNLIGGQWTKPNWFDYFIKMTRVGGWLYAIQNFPNRWAGLYGPTLGNAIFLFAGYGAAQVLEAPDLNASGLLLVFLMKFIAPSIHKSGSLARSKGKEKDFVQNLLVKSLDGKTTSRECRALFR